MSEAKNTSSDPNRRPPDGSAASAIGGLDALIVNTVREPLVVLDMDLRVVSANASFYETFDVRQEETEGRLIYELGNNQWDIPQLRELLEEILPEHTAFSDFEVEHTFERIGRRSMRLNARRIDAKQLILLAIEDITLRRTTEAQLEQEKSLAQLYLDVAGVIMVALDREGHVTMINRAGCEILGYPEDEIVGQDWFAHFLPERDRKPVRKVFETLIGGNEKAAKYYENPVLTKGGEERVIFWHNTFIHDEQGEVVGTLGSGTDITERRQTEEVNRRLAAIVESSEDAIIGQTIDGIITHWNQGAVQMYGYAPEEAVGKPISIIVPEERRGEVARFLAAIQRRERVRHFETVRTRKDGSSLHVSLGVSPVNDAEGSLIAISSIARDITQRKQAEDALRRSEQRFRATFEQVTVGMAHVAEDGTWLRVNHRLCEIVGYTSDELLQKAFQDITHPDDVAADVEQARRLWAGEIQTYTLEKRYLRKDGSTVWANLTGSVVRDAEPDGRPLYFVATIEDISARKQAEEALRLSEERFRNLFEASPDAIFVEDLAGNVLDVNPAACRLHNSGRDALVGKNVHDLVPPDQREAALQDFEKLVSGELDYVQTYSWAINEHAVPVEIRANRFAYDGHEAVLLIVRDISERLKAEAALEESQAHARAILETTVDAVLTISEQGLIETVNPATVRLFGYRTEELIGQNVKMLMPAPYQEEHDQYLRAYLETGEKKIIGMGREVTAQRKDGTTFPIDLAVSEVRLGNRRIFTGFIRDISDRRRLEHEVLRISEEERQRIGQDIHDQLASQFSGIALLGRGFVNQWKKEQAVSAEMLEEVVLLARSGAEQARALAWGLSPVKLDREGLKAALKELAHSAETLAGIAYRLDMDDELPPLEGNTATQLYRIAQEAVTNAIKHAGAKNLTLRMHRNEDRLDLTVRDDGAGLPKDVKEGGGMGRHIMPYRARMIGATLTIDSAPDAGTTVTCSVPLSMPLPSR